jgi:hypothetical protein
MAGSKGSRVLKQAVNANIALFLGGDGAKCWVTQFLLSTTVTHSTMCNINGPNILGVLALEQVGACACVAGVWALPVDEKCVEQAAACCSDRLWQVQSGADVSPD